MAPDNCANVIAKETLEWLKDLVYVVVDSNDHLLILNHMLDREAGQWSAVHLLHDVFFNTPIACVYDTLKIRNRYSLVYEYDGLIYSMRGGCNPFTVSKGTILIDSYNAVMSLEAKNYILNDSSLDRFVWGYSKRVINEFNHGTETDMCSGALV